MGLGLRNALTVLSEVKVGELGFGIQLNTVLEDSAVTSTHTHTRTYENIKRDHSNT